MAQGNVSQSLGASLSQGGPYDGTTAPFLSASWVGSGVKGRLSGACVDDIYSRDAAGHIVDHLTICRVMESLFNTTMFI